MKVTVRRIAKKPKYTIGRVYIDDVYICDSIEDKDRALTQTTKLQDIKKVKVQNETAIPTGTYKLTMKVQSPRFSRKEFYKKYCNGYLPRILNVPGFDGILLHCGATQNSTSGCIILGYNKIVGRVVDSEKAFKTVYETLKTASDKGEEITITIL